MKNQKFLNKYKKYFIAIIIAGIVSVIFSIIKISEYTDYNVEENTILNIDIEKPKQFNKLLYENYPLAGDYIGTINIPTLNKILPLYEGTSNSELKKGVGHFIESVLPGELSNSVISGHRYTVFTEIGKLKIKDMIIIKTDTGKFTYEVFEIKIVKKDDKTIIVPTKEAILTLTTCYPFNYINLSPKRYIISSKLIKKNIK